MKIVLACILSLFATVCTAATVTVSPNSDAASKTANSLTNVCNRVKPFYWEIGNASGPIISGVVGKEDVHGPTIKQNIASSSKMVYGAYVLQRPGGLPDKERQFLNLTSGYHGMSVCLKNQTTESCLESSTNGKFTSSDVGKFYYDGAHMQRHAASYAGLGQLRPEEFASAINKVLGTSFEYKASWPAGGITTTPQEYAKFLQAVVAGKLVLRDHLGEKPVCTDSATCKTALNSPVPDAWQYSTGHWVESTVDGAFSSPGAFGFYPWISSDKTLYGIVDSDKFIWSVVQCGGMIRKAYISGKPILTAPPRKERRAKATF